MTNSFNMKEQKKGTKANKKPAPVNTSGIPYVSSVGLDKNIKELGSILVRCRSAESEEEAEFVAWLKTQLPADATEDGYGNVHCQVGEHNGVLFSCHTDTVHNNPKLGSARQIVYYDPILYELFVQNDSKCLGADDGVGCWIMLNMIRAKVPGYYIFHRAEERGGLGSRWLANNDKALLKQFKMAIAFDRKGSTDIITHQGSRTASDKFAEAISKALSDADADLKLTASKNGTFTDTKSYAQLIPECTNLSVGYDRQHTSNETLSVKFAEKILKAALVIKWSELPVHRDPVKDNDNAYSNGPYGDYSNYGNGHYGGKKATPVKPFKPKAVAPPQPDLNLRGATGQSDMLRSEILTFVYRYPEVIADLLADYGVQFNDIDTALFEHFLASDIGGIPDDFPLDS